MQEIQQKKILTLDEYYRKKKNRFLEDAFIRAKHIFEVTGNYPTEKEMGWFNVLWFERNNKNEQFLRNLTFKGDDIDEVIKCFYSLKPHFSSFSDFLSQCFVKFSEKK